MSQATRIIRLGTLAGVLLAFATTAAIAHAANGNDGSDGSDGRPPADSPEFAVWVMEKVDDVQRGAHSHGKMKMEVKTAHWERSMTMESWSLGKDYSLVRILSPRKEKGTATLKANKDLFTYLSKSGRTIKIASGMMGGSWMGSHFTNDDLVRETRLSEAFDIKLVFDGDDGGVAVYRFSLVPKPNTPVVWGRIDVTVRKSDLQPLRQVFADEDGKDMRVLTFSRHEPHGSRTLPMEMEMRPLDLPGEYTRTVIQSIDFDTPIDAGFFTLQRLKSSR